MRLRTTVLGSASASALLAMIAAAPAAQAQQQACPGDNGGITLSPGFCATVFADHLGHVRHMVVGAERRRLRQHLERPCTTTTTRRRPAASWSRCRTPRDAGQADKIERFGPPQRTATPAAPASRSTRATSMPRPTTASCAMPCRSRRRRADRDGRRPSCHGLPITGDHPMHPFSIDRQGNLYVDLGSATNSCQAQNRMPDVPGQNPCTELRDPRRHVALRCEPADQQFLPGGALRHRHPQRRGLSLRLGRAHLCDPARPRPALRELARALHQPSRAPTSRPRS